MAALVSNVATPANGGTSSAINTTGATLLVMTTTCPGSSSPTPSDSLGNTWTLITSEYNTQTLNAMWYVSNPTVGSSQTFTYSAGTSCAQVTAWSGVSLLQTSTGADASSNVATLQPGSITPSQNNSVIITSCSQAAQGSTGPTLSINDGFTISNQTAATYGVDYGGGQAYLIQSTAAAINPTWTVSNNTFLAATIAAFYTSTDDLTIKATTGKPSASVSLHRGEALSVSAVTSKPTVSSTMKRGEALSVSATIAKPSVSIHLEIGGRLSVSATAGRPTASVHLERGERLAIVANAPRPVAGNTYTTSVVLTQFAASGVTTFDVASTTGVQVGSTISSNGFTFGILTDQGNTFVTAVTATTITTNFFSLDSLTAGTRLSFTSTDFGNMAIGEKLSVVATTKKPIASVSATLETYIDIEIKAITRMPIASAYGLTAKAAKERTISVCGERRTIAVPGEQRTIDVPGERRTVSVPA